MSTLAPARPAPVLGSTLVDIATGLAAAPDLWRPHLDALAGSRRGVRLLATDAYDVWLLGWPPGANVEPHDHGDAQGAFVVVAGGLVEVRWSGWARTSRRLGPGDTAAFGVGVVHDVMGAGPTTAVSLHVYSPPLQEMRFYDDDARRVIAVEAVS